MSEKPIKFDSNAVKTEVLEQEPELTGNDELLRDKAQQLPVLDGRVKLKAKKSKSKLWRIFGFSFGALVLSASLYEAWQFSQEMFAISTGLGVAILTLLVVTITTGLVALVKGRLKNGRLKERQQVRKQLAQFNATKSYGNASKVLDNVTEEFQQEVDISQTLAVYKQSIQKSHDDSELIQIYSDKVLNGLDKLALEAIHKHAAESALMAALSPLAVADMALVAWRSSRMIQEISRIYGCPQTAFGRLGLTKQVATNLMLAGASEFVAEAGVELLGKSVAATVSTKMAQGIGVGILVSRLGIQSMQVCRPIEFTKEDKPKLGDIRKVLTSKVIAMVSSKKNEKVLKQGEQDD